MSTSASMFTGSYGPTAVGLRLDPSDVENAWKTDNALLGKHISRVLADVSCLALPFTCCLGTGNFPCAAVSTCVLYQASRKIKIVTDDMEIDTQRSLQRAFESIDESQSPQYGALKATKERSEACFQQIVAYLDTASLDPDYKALVEKFFGQLFYGQMVEFKTHLLGELEYVEIMMKEPYKKNVEWLECFYLYVPQRVRFAIINWQIVFPFAHERKGTILQSDGGAILKEEKYLSSLVMFNGKLKVVYQPNDLGLLYPIHCSEKKVEPLNWLDKIV